MTKYDIISFLKERSALNGKAFIEECGLNPSYLYHDLDAVMRAKTVLRVKFIMIKYGASIRLQSDTTSDIKDNPS